MFFVWMVGKTISKNYMFHFNNRFVIKHNRDNFLDCYKIIRYIVFGKNFVHI